MSEPIQDRVFFEGDWPQPKVYQFAGGHAAVCSRRVPDTAAVHALVATDEDEARLAGERIEVPRPACASSDGSTAGGIDRRKLAKAIPLSRDENAPPGSRRAG